jgi:type I restriction enzyme, S subunit
MSEWMTVNLGSLADSTPGSIAIGPFGSRMKSDTYVSDGVPVIRGTNISSNRSWKGDWVFVPDEFAETMPNCIVREGDLVFPHRGSIGEVAIVPSDQPRYMLSTSLMKFRPDDKKASALFLYYFFRSNQGRSEILRFSSQVGTPGIGQPLSSLRQFRVPLPPREIQEEIVSLLALLDDKIDLIHRTNGTLEAMASAFFKDWFVDFGPTRAKIEHQPPYIASEFWDLFPNAFNGDNKPVGWRTWTLGELAEHRKGSVTPSADPYTIFEHYSLPAFDAGQHPAFDLGSSIKSNKTPIPKGAVLLSKLNPEIPRVWVPGDPTDAPQVASTEFLVFVPRMGIGRALIAALFNNPCFRQILQGMVTGTSSSHQRVSPSAVVEIEGLIGDRQVFIAYESIMAPILAKILKNRQELCTLAKTRDLLLPKLMSGEIRLRNTEKIVAEVM